MIIIVQVGFQISQSVVLRYLIDYFGIECPTAEDTRNAYLFAAGKLFGGEWVVVGGGGGDDEWWGWGCYWYRWELECPK